MAIQDEVPKSRLTLRYMTEVDGTPQEVDLPMRFMILGDFSFGTSVDRKVDLDERRLRTLDGTNTASVMKDMKTTLSFSVKDRITNEEDSEIPVDLKIESMKDLTPPGIAQQMPKIKSLLLLKTLLEEVQSNISNTKDFRKLVTELYTNEEAYNNVIGELKGFDSFKLP
ncbi:type VI secretion system contractile sheath small subunit [Planctomycetota bacterium]